MYLKLNLIKYLALISMIIDHVGKIFYPEIIELRYIGRFAFIAFSIILVYNFKFNTSNKDNYINRLLLWGTISIVPYIILFESLNFNILVTFALGLFLIKKVDEKKYFWLFLLFLSPIVEYSIFGIIFIMALYFLNNNIFSIAILLILAYLTNYYDFYMGLAAALSFLLYILVLKNNKYDLPKLKGIYFYIFYPLHMIILKSIKVFS